LGCTPPAAAADGRVAAGSDTAREHPPWSAAYLRSSLNRQLSSTFLPSGYPSSVAPGYLRFVWWQGLHHFAGSVNGGADAVHCLGHVGVGRSLCAFPRCMRCRNHAKSHHSCLVHCHPPRLPACSCTAVSRPPASSHCSSLLHPATSIDSCLVNPHHPHPFLAAAVLASTFLLYSVGLGAGAIPTAGALNWVLKDGLGQLGTLLFGKAIAHSFDVNARMWYLAASTKLNLAMG
jgi:hypothetical protein